MLKEELVYDRICDVLLDVFRLAMWVIVGLAHRAFDNVSQMS